MSWKEQVVATEFDPDIIPFWDGLRRHEFLLYRCTLCGAYYWPMTYCPAHDDIPRLSDMEWAPTSGQGTVFAWCIVHHVTNQAYAAEAPYALAMVELDEGPLFPTRIVGCNPQDVRVGLPVRVLFDDVPETEMTLPLFTPRPIAPAAPDA